ncbi:hypothetical protein [Paracidovorax avenae]|uniref:hypothetical protein n=1 Tax=Paracidovorax avenae TaxID=80867 RepID=UPI0006B389DD|nr:hypothetical protein [Paracidovorax avenae]
MGFIAFLGALIGALVLAASFFIANGAPQEAAMAAMACAFAVIPYVLFRVRQLSAQEDELHAFRKELMERLDRLPPPPSS